ncbi:MAG: endonuclease/exonuclease/phosphatase family protein [Nitratireductor sp.]|nr:endonuclease/exonuclease/phosphatase family protein [Nitratireductor sp.]
MFRLALLFLSLGLIAALAFGFLGALHPAFDTFAHFRWHLALGLLALGIVALILRIPRAPLILLVFAALGIWQSGADNRIGEPGAGAARAGNAGYSLLSFNLRFDNPDRSAVVAMILATDADILTLSETSRLWQDALETLDDRYPYRFHCPEWSRIGGTMTFSKFPIREDGQFCADYAAYSKAVVEIGGRPVSLGNVHLRWPWPASGPRQVRVLQGELGTIGEDALVAGDFNATVWSDTAARFARFAGLQIARGYGGTWMHKLLSADLAPVLGLPIDLVMHKGVVEIRSVRTLPAIGSDHLPLLVEFDLQ